jgi:hypothetical protein
MLVNILFITLGFSASVHAAAEPPAYQGAARCIDCHTQPNPLRESDGTTEWVALSEAHTWLTADKHAQAFKTLESEYSQQIGKRLGIDDVRKDPRCLSCHAGWSKGDRAPPHLELGVSCEACHGPGSLYDAEHTRPAWRTKTADEKAVLGMVDVRHPRLRAERCLSCHLGSAAEGKWLTHAMYAAGHPPLAGFELSAYSRAMPRHWRELEDKGNTVRGNADIRTAIGYRDGELQAVKSVVIGGVVTLRESTRLQDDWQRLANTGDWPDFAQYDCASCHHELEQPSWRQARRAAVPPGKLFPPAWPNVLAELAMRHLGRDNLAEERRLRRELDAHANDAQIGPLDELVRQLDSLPYDRAAATAILRDLADLGQRPDLDFDSARQLGWALQSISLATDARQAEAMITPGALIELDALLLLELPSALSQAILDPRRREAMYRVVGEYQPGLANACFTNVAASIRQP